MKAERVGKVIERTKRRRKDIRYAGAVHLMGPVAWARVVRMSEASRKEIRLIVEAAVDLLWLSMQPDGVGASVRQAVKRKTYTRQHEDAVLRAKLNRTETKG